MSKRFGPLAFKGSTQEKSLSEIFHFGYGKAANDPAGAGVPDRVGSGACLRSVVIMAKRLWLLQKRNNWALEFSDNDKRLLTVVGISASEGVQKDRDSDA
jgi:hypothetical protein